MAEEETRAVCPNCKSDDWTEEKVLNSTDGIGIIQATCNDCGQNFEINVKTSTPGWTSLKDLYGLEWSETDPES